MTTRRFLILISYVLALFTALVLALLLARIPLTELIATRLLESAGLKHAAVRIQQIDLNRLVLSRLDVTRAADGGTSRIEAKGVQIDFQAAQLTEGRLDHIHIEHLALHHESADGAPAEPLDNAALLQLLNTDWSSMVPFKTLAIEQIELQGTGFGLLERTAHRLLIKKSANAIECRLLMLDAQSQDRIVIATLSGASLEIALGLAAQPDQSALHATIDTSASGIDMHWRLSPKMLRSWLSPLVQIADVDMGSPLSGQLQLDLTKQDLINANLRAETGYYRFEAYKLLRPLIKLDIQVNTDIQAGKIDILPGSFARIAGVESDTFSIGNSKLNMLAAITNRSDQWTVDGTATLPRLAVTYTDYAFALKDIESRVHADTAGVSLTASFSPETLPGLFAIDVSHSTESASGQAGLRMPQAIDLDAEDRHLGQLLGVWPFEFDLASGTLQFDGNAAWSGGTVDKLSAGVRLVNIGGHYNELLFSGLTYRQQIELLPSISSPRPGKLSLEHIDAGVAIDNVNARISAGPSEYGSLPKLVIGGLKGQLFDGAFYAEPFTYDLSAPANALTIHAAGIDLAEVVATQQFRNIEVSGRIDGLLPVEINPFGLFINNGHLHNANSSGVIRYKPDASGGLEQNPLTDIALKALSDFHYDTLKARANYVPEGTLALNFELSGTSPPLQTTRPVHLNINTEQNLLSLLKSIRYVEGLNKNLDKSVRQMYQKKSGG